MMKPSLALNRDAKPRRELGSMRQFRRPACANMCRRMPEYVGPKIAEEARKIHYGETFDRHIYGETTPEEARALEDEGVMLHLCCPL